MSRDLVLRRATFDPRLKVYGLVQGTIAMIVSIVTIPLVPFWLLGVGQMVEAKRFEALRCELTERTLNISRGVLFPVEKNVPLDKITDLAMHGGPILSYFGLTRLHVETAGQSGPGALVSLVGMVDAEGFRNAVLAQRDLVSSGGAPAALPTPAAAANTADQTLVEIRDSLQRIEKLLERQS